MLRIQNGGVILGKWKKVWCWELGMGRDFSKDVAKEVVSGINWLEEDEEWSGCWQQKRILRGNTDPIRLSYAMIPS